MRAMVVGGPQHGEWIDTLDGATAWINIRNGDTHRIRKLVWAIQDLRTGEIAETYEIRLAVHLDLTGQQETPMVMQLLQLYAMGEFARAHGTPVQAPETPKGIILADRNGGAPA